jgi:hypothetical protein
MNEDESWPYYFIIIITPGLIISFIIGGQRIFRCSESRCWRGIEVCGGSFVPWCHYEARASDLYKGVIEFF